MWTWKVNSAQNSDSRCDSSENHFSCYVFFCSFLLFILWPSAILFMWRIFAKTHSALRIFQRHIVPSMYFAGLFVYVHVFIRSHTIGCFEEDEMKEREREWTRTKVYCDTLRVSLSIWSKLYFHKNIAQFFVRHTKVSLAPINIYQTIVCKIKSPIIPFEKYLRLMKLLFKKKIFVETLPRKLESVWKSGKLSRFTLLSFPQFFIIIIDLKYW